MRVRLGIILAYLLLGCLLLEDALPYFAQSNTMEICEYKTDSGEKQVKKEKDQEDGWNELRDKIFTSRLLLFSLKIQFDSLHDKIAELPDSPHRTIFSPPPNRV